MRNSSSAKEKNAWKPRGAELALETDPLLTGSYAESSNIRERRKSGSSNNASNPQQQQQHQQQQQSHFDMSPQDNEYAQQPYNALRDDLPSRSGDGHSVNSSHSGGSRSVHQLRRHYVARGSGSGEHPPLLEIPEEIYSVRKSALTVLKPLTRTWVSRYCSGMPHRAKLVLMNTDRSVFISWLFPWGLR